MFMRNNQLWLSLVEVAKLPQYDDPMLNLG